VRPGLLPGYNVDIIDEEAGLARAAGLGYGSAQHQMVVSYALYRRSRGEEDGAQRAGVWPFTAPEGHAGYRPVDLISQ
jgi:hypothetical protein